MIVICETVQTNKATLMCILCKLLTTLSYLHQTVVNHNYNRIGNMVTYQKENLTTKKYITAMQKSSSDSPFSFRLIPSIYPPIVVHGHYICLEFGFQSVQVFLSPGLPWLHNCNDCQLRMLHNSVFEYLVWVLTVAQKMFSQAISSRSYFSSKWTKCICVVWPMCM